MEDNTSLVNREKPITRMLERAALFYEGPLTELRHIPESWSPEDRRACRAEWWENGAQRCCEAEECAAASQCYANARAACSDSPQGRPEWSGRFGGPEEFRQTVVSDLVALMTANPPKKPTMDELATLWNEEDPTVYSDSVVTRIKRYCKKSGYAWKTLKTEAIQRTQGSPS